eukprot:521281_1
MRRSPTRRLAQPYHQSLVLRLNVTLVIALVLTLLRIDEVNSFGANGVLGNKNVHVRGLNGLVRPKVCSGTAMSTGNRAIFAERRSVDDREKSSSELCPGSHVALVTPFHEKGGEIDEISLRKLLKWHLDSGTNGILALGTTGEANMLTYAEKTLVLRTCQEEIGGRIPLICGVGGGGLDTLNNIKLAHQFGANAILAVTPPYTKPPQRGLVKYFTDLADESPLPVVLYNVPGRAGVDMVPETVIQVAQHPRIIAIKEATGDVSRVPSILSGTPDGFMLFGGDDAEGRNFVSKGGHGVMSVTANVAPAQMATMISNALQGRNKDAKNSDDCLSLLHSRLFVESNPIPVKAALKLMGRIPSARMRIPLMEMDSIHVPMIKEALATANCLS